MKYPRKPLEEHKTYKILPSEYPKVIKMRNTIDPKTGKPFTITKIALTFHVGKQTINFILNPELRALHNEKVVARAKERLEKDPEFREYHSQEVNKYLSERTKVDKNFKKYHQEIITNANRKRKLTMKR